MPYVEELPATLGLEAGAVLVDQGQQPARVTSFGPVAFARYLRDEGEPAPVSSLATRFDEILRAKPVPPQGIEIETALKGYNTSVAELSLYFIGVAMRESFSLFRRS